MVTHLNTAILIPAYQPDDKLTHLVELLSALPFSLLLVIDDGSDAGCREVFSRCAAYDNCVVIAHATNRGKGAALKTGLRYLLDNRPDIEGCITVDADGQHLPEDILKVAEALAKQPDSLILGSRDFSEHTVPMRSRFGNKMTRGLYKLITRQKVTDTQTGLRAFTRRVFADFAVMDGDRYEYEMNMLMQASALSLPIVEVTIHTVYIEHNATSHFKPVSDSFKVYKQLLKFVGSSALCALVDIGLFAVFFWLFTSLSLPGVLLLSTVAARACSSVVNFLLNKHMVFRAREKDKRHAYKYFTLVVVQMLASWLLLKLVVALFSGVEVVLLKALVDVTLFFISFVIQRLFVFARKEKQAHEA